MRKLTGPGVSGDYRKSELEFCSWDEQIEFVKDLKVEPVKMLRTGMGREEGLRKGWCASLFFKKGYKNEDFCVFYKNPEAPVLNFAQSLNVVCERHFGGERVCFFPRSSKP